MAVQSTRKSIAFRYRRVRENVLQVQERKQPAQISRRAAHHGDRSFGCSLLRQLHHRLWPDRRLRGRRRAGTDHNRYWSVAVYFAYFRPGCNMPLLFNRLGLKDIVEAGTTDALCSVASAMADALGGLDRPATPFTRERLDRRFIVRRAGRCHSWPAGRTCPYRSQCSPRGADSVPENRLKAGRPF